MRIPLPIAVGATIVAIVGGAGLVRGAQPLPVGKVGSSSSSAPIVVSNAYVRAPAPPTDSAAAYFTVYNTTAIPDYLETVVSGAGEVTVLHTGAMTTASGNLLIPAHGSVTLTTGGGHAMIENLYGTLKAGQSVSLELTFENGGVVDVTAPVIALGAPAPTSGGGS